MGIPQQVIDQAAAEDRALDELQKNINQGSEAPVAVADPTPVAPPVDPEHTPIIETPPVQQTIEERYAILQQQLDQANQRNETLQGKYTAEVPRLSSELRMQKAELEALRAASAARSSIAPQAPGTPAVPEREGIKKYVTDEDIENFGEDAVNMAGRVAKGYAADLVQVELQKLRNEYDRRLDPIEKQRHVQAASALWQSIEAEYPGAIEINEKDPNWVTFLSSVDPISGRQRRDLAVTAMEAGKPSWVADLFREYKGPGAPARSPSAVPSQQKPASVGPEVNNAQHIGTPKGRFIPESEIKRFYDDKALGRLRVGPEEAAALEHEYELAEAEGRIAAAR